jgi:ComF family protein
VFGRGPSWRPALADLLAAVLHLIFPATCHVCCRPLDRRRHSALCGRCWDGLERMPREGCVRCGWPLPGPDGARGVEAPLCQRCRETRDHFGRARAVLRYREDGIARAAILLCKHGRCRPLLQHLGRLLAEEAPRHLPLAEYDAVIPVPLHWRRRLARGFNQAEVLARAVGRAHGLRVRPWVLRRVRPTPPQQGDREARRRNVRQAFAVRGRRGIVGRRLLLVDDVFTTGATANACAEVLLAAGAASVDVLALARVE